MHKIDSPSHSIQCLPFCALKISPFASITVLAKKIVCVRCPNFQISIAEIGIVPKSRKYVAAEVCRPTTFSRVCGTNIDAKSQIKLLSNFLCRRFISHHRWEEYIREKNADE